METNTLKVIATILALIVGLVVFAALPALLLVLLVTTIVGIVLWIFMGKVYTSRGVIRFMLWLRGRTIAQHTDDDPDLRDLDNLEQGFFILESEEEETEKETPKLPFKKRFFSHLRECLTRPWVPILFLVSLAINLMKFADYIPALGVEMTIEEATQLLINVNTIIFLVSPIILAFIIPGVFLLQDFSLYFFHRTKGHVEIEKSVGFGQTLLEGFVGGSALLGIIKFLIELATSPSDLSGYIALVLLIAIGGAAWSIVLTLFFYLPFHRRYVGTLNEKLKRIGLPRANVEINKIEETPLSVVTDEKTSI